MKFQLNAEKFIVFKIVFCFPIILFFLRLSIYNFFQCFEFDKLEIELELGLRFIQARVEKSNIYVILHLIFHPIKRNLDHKYKQSIVFYDNKDENVHKFSLSAIRGELLEREREKERELVLGYLGLPIIHSKD